MQACTRTVQCTVYTYSIIKDTGTHRATNILLLQIDSDTFIGMYFFDAYVLNGRYSRTSTSTKIFILLHVLYEV